MRGTTDLSQARQFLELLRPKAKLWTFQTFDDKAERKDARLTCMLHGHLDEHIEELVKLNRKGAGIFVAINLTDGRGRKKENIKKVRAIAVDLDGAPLDAVQACALEPHIIVETSEGRYHAYWRTKDVKLNEFEDFQRGLAARFDGDPSVALLTHVARIPGFSHNKAQPFSTRIIAHHDGPAYTRTELAREFAPQKRPHKKRQSNTSALILSPKSPRNSAIEFLKRKCMQGDAQAPAFGLHYYRNSFYKWSGTHFRALSVDAIRSDIYSFCDDAITHDKDGEAPFHPTASKVTAIIDALKAGILLPEDENPPFWIGDKPLENAGLIAFQNGLLEVDTGRLAKHTPYFFNVNCLPFEFDSDAPRPKRWLAFLREVWPEDQDARRALQEIFGLLLTSDTRYQKIFMIIGPKRSGKGTIGRVLTELLGRDNVVNPTLASLGSQFGLSTLIDKRAAIIADARIGSSIDGNLVAERLLSISGEDAQTIDIKYRSHWTGRLAVRFLILTNELPRINDASNALSSRFVLLPIKETFYGREDQGLTDTLLQELPGILNWALEGLDRLQERGFFKAPGSSVEAIRALEDLASPVGAFLREWCEFRSGERIEVKRMYDAWTKWCGLHGHRPQSSAMFGRNLHAAFPQVTARGRGASRFYQGLCLSQRGEKEYSELEFSRS